MASASSDTAGRIVMTMGLKAPTSQYIRNPRKYLPENAAQAKTSRPRAADRLVTLQDANGRIFRAYDSSDYRFGSRRCTCGSEDHPRFGTDSDVVHFRRLVCAYQ